MNAWADALCDQEIACGLLEPAYRADCVEVTLDNIAGALPFMPVTGVGTGRYVYDGASAAACLVGIAAASCRFDLLHDPPLRALCLSAVRGAAPGASCRSAHECASGACDVAAGCAAVCVDGPSLPAQGEPCTGRCAAGLSCITAAGGSTGTCRAPGVAGDPCNYRMTLSSLGQCAAGLACDYTLPTPTCVPLRAAGESCGALDACKDGLRCVGLAPIAGSPPFAAGACARPLATGSPCKLAPHSVDPCTHFTQCLGSCTPRGLLGQPCLSDDFVACYVGYCAEGDLCTAQRPENAPCTIGTRQCRGAEVCDPMTLRCGGPLTCGGG